MSHLFVAPHPDDVALSCGGLIALLRAKDEAVTIVTVFSGTGRTRQLTRYQREALGFGEIGTELGSSDGADAANAVMATRRSEDAAYASLAGASIVHLDLPDAVFRGYEGDAELMGEPRPDDASPLGELRAQIAAHAPAAVYFPLGVGGHVDHRQVRNAGLAMVAAAVPLRKVVFYDDVPYSYRLDFHGLRDLPPDALAGLPDGFTLVREYVEVADVLDRKVEALRAYGSQLARQFGGAREMVEAMRAGAARTGADGGVGPAERYWVAKRCDACLGR